MDDRVGPWNTALTAVSYTMWFLLYSIVSMSSLLFGTINVIMTSWFWSNTHGTTDTCNIFRNLFFNYLLRKYQGIFKVNVEKRHDKFRKTALNNLSISKSQKWTESVEIQWRSSLVSRSWHWWKVRSVVRSLYLVKCQFVS